MASHVAERCKAALCSTRLRPANIACLVMLPILTLVLLANLHNDSASRLLLSPARLIVQFRRTDVEALRGYANMPSDHATDSKWCKSILLIVIFNFPYFENIPVIRRLYQDAFTKVVFYADVAEDNQTVRASRVEQGFYQQRAIAQAMEEEPGYDGYMWIGDDVLLNPYLVLSKLDMTKVWIARFDELMYCLANENRSICGQHYHWDMKYGRAAANESIRCLPKSYRQRAMMAMGCKDCVAKGASDAGFIPAAHVAEFRLLAGVFQNLFFEFAVPTIMLLIHTDPGSIPHSNSFYSWSTNATVRYDEVRWNWKATATDFVHPVKLSVPAQRANALDWLAEARRRNDWIKAAPCIHKVSLAAERRNSGDADRNSFHANESKCRADQ